MGIYRKGLKPSALVKILTRNVDSNKALKTRGRKPKIDGHNNYCRFCGTSLTSDGARASLENLLLPSERQESPQLILAGGCGSIGLPLSRNQNLSNRSAYLMAPRLRNAAELYNFIEKAIATKVQEDLNREAGCEDRTKQALPATVTPKQRTDHCWNGQFQEGLDF